MAKRKQRNLDTAWRKMVADILRPYDAEELIRQVRQEIADTVRSDPAAAESRP